MAAARSGPARRGMAAARVLALLLLAPTAFAVDRSKFRTCNDASFCRRHRDVTSEPAMQVVSGSSRVDGGVGHAKVSSAAPGAPPFDLSLRAYASGVVRVRILEHNDLPPRWESPDVIVESSLVSIPLTLLPASDALPARVLGAASAAASASAGVSFFSYTLPSTPATGFIAATGLTRASASTFLVALHHSPLRVDLWDATTAAAGGAGSGVVAQPLIIINGRGLSYFEHRRKKDDGSAAAVGGAAASATPVAQERRVLHWGEDGKAVYEPEDGEETVAEGEEGDATADSGAAAAAAAVAPPASEQGLWVENFGSHVDSKPNGPMSVGFDVTFPGASTLYGVPEHASSHALHATDGSESVEGGGVGYNQPYRLYNLDVFEYELDNTMALYGSIPFLVAHAAPVSSSPASAGIFWNNPTETYVDITKQAGGGSVGARWISESGVFDISLLPGSSGKAVISQLTSLVGNSALPPLFALGYHQCRWNYKDEADIYAVDSKFEEHAFPYDVLWLDIEHTQGKKYFTWDPVLFPNPAAMQDKLAARGHKMVTIIDPHIKRDSGFWIHTEAQSRALYTRNKDGGEYEGHCWPGASSYLDFTSPVTRDWWAAQFAPDKYKGSTLSLYTWNDMNEPSVFNGPEVSMHKDALSIAGVEHREWHNLYGLYQAMATAEGQVRRSGPDRNARSFVLSRAFSAGTARFAAIWTGDNAAKWEHLAAAAPMLLTIGVSGLSFAGADVGGFFTHPSAELMTRWYQAGSFQPFFRAHAHIDTPRREPWLFGDDTLSALRDIVNTRYSYLPLWYTLFAAANATGVPPMRPMWLEFPSDPAATTLDDQWMVGSELLVKPVTTQGATSADVYFPRGGAPWYDAETLHVTRGGGDVNGIVMTIPAPLGKIPVFVKGGAIVPRQMRPRRASAAMINDPYTLIVALDASHARASGYLYLDDGVSYDFTTKAAFRLRALEYAPRALAGAAAAASGGSVVHVLRSTLAAGGKTYAPANTIERILIAGLGRSPMSVVVTPEGGGVGGAGAPIEFEYDAAGDVLTLRKPLVRASYDWEIVLTLPPRK